MNTFCKNINLYLCSALNFDFQRFLTEYLSIENDILYIVLIFVLQHFQKYMLLCKIRHTTLNNIKKKSGVIRVFKNN